MRVRGRVSVRVRVRRGAATSGAKALEARKVSVAALKRLGLEL